MERSCVHVRNVHGYLGDTVFLDVPADCLAALKCSRNPNGLSAVVLENLSGEAASLSCRTAFLSDIECDCHCTACGCGVQVEVDRDKEVTCSDIGSASLGNCLIVLARAEIRFPLRVIDLFRQSLIFACAAYCEIFSLRLVGCRLVAVARNSEFVVDPFCEASGHFSTFFQCGSGNWDERQYVRCS